MIVPFVFPATLIELPEAIIYEYTSTDGTTKVVVTFTPVAGKDYKDIIPPKESDDASKPTGTIFNVIVSINLFNYRY